MEFSMARVKNSFNPQNINVVLPNKDYYRRRYNSPYNVILPHVKLRSILIVSNYSEI